jgi:tRNA pseudouridine55 synthase
MEGESEQIPPMHSAISINGTRLYELARKGIEVERTPRKIQIFEIEILNDLPEVIQAGTLTELRVQCSKGTYIRSFVMTWERESVAVRF